MKITSRFILFIWLAAILFVGGCATGTTYQTPDQSPELSIPGPKGGFPSE